MVQYGIYKKVVPVGTALSFRYQKKKKAAEISHFLITTPQMRPETRGAGANNFSENF